MILFDKINFINQNHLSSFLANLPILLYMRIQFLGILISFLFLGTQLAMAGGYEIKACESVINSAVYESSDLWNNQYKAINERITMISARCPEESKTQNGAIKLAQDLTSLGQEASNWDKKASTIGSQMKDAFKQLNQKSDCAKKLAEAYKQIPVMEVEINHGMRNACGRVHPTFGSFSERNSSLIKQ